MGFSIGGGIPAILLVLLLPTNWLFTPGFFFSATFIIAFGSTFAAAMVAPRAKFIVAIACSLFYTIAPFVIWGDVVEEHPPAQLPSYAKFAPFSYGLGALLAMALVYIIRRRKTYIEPQENAVEPPRPDEPSSAGAPEGR